VSIAVRTFEPNDQSAVRALILEGFRERFGWIDESMNPDLDDIAASYSGALFVVASDGSEIVGTGALTRQDDGTAIVTRMSTAARHRRRGIGRAVLAHLLNEAEARVCSRLVLGTNIEWKDAIAFYLACGFEEMRRTPTGVLFEKVL
jgi:GNAT superfamily N-acetyltransferase